MDIEREMRNDLPKDRKIVSEFLERFGLSFEDVPEYTVAIFRDGEIIGTGSLQGRVLKNLAVSENLQGEGLLLRILSLLMSYANGKGIHSFLLFTKPENMNFFQTAGFQLVASASPYASLLEIGPENIDAWLGEVGHTYPAGINYGCIVMNANPFTLGHRALALHAAQNCDFLMIFVVEEDASVFPFADRLELVKKGTRDIDNIVVLPGGDYIISKATFPSYFVKGKDALIAQTRLDASVFAGRIAPALGIKKRFVAEEPNDETTNTYNQALMEILPENGVELEIIERVTYNGVSISASAVRKALARGDWQTVEKLVPETTLSYLLSDKGSYIVDKIKAGGKT